MKQKPALLKRGLTKTVVSGLMVAGSVALSGGVLPIVATASLCVYNATKAINSEIKSRKKMKNSEIYLVYFDLQKVKNLQKIRNFIPDNPINDILGELTNTKFAHCALEICDSDIIYRFEVSSDLNNEEILAIKPGVFAAGKKTNFLTNDGVVYLLLKVFDKETKYDCLEMKKIGNTKKNMEKIINVAKFIFENTNPYDLFKNNCQDFAKGLSRAIK